MVAILVGLGFVMGPIPLLKLYGVPYVVSLINFFYTVDLTIFWFFSILYQELIAYFICIEM